MFGGRRIVTEVSPGIRYPASRDPKSTCRRTIKLDGVTYRCGREVGGIDRTHSGIHDAFAVHGDGGMIRW